MIAQYALAAGEPVEGTERSTGARPSGRKELPLDTETTTRAKSASVSAPLVWTSRSTGAEPFTRAEPFTVGARDLATLAGPEPCPACFRIRLLTKGAFPYQIPVAGLVHAVDSLAKDAVRGALEREKRLPAWMPDLGPVRGYVRNVDARWFRDKDPDSKITVIGVPDDILVLEDGSVHVVDYKAARFTLVQEALLPLYEAQLNVYAHLAERLRPYVPGPVSGLTLLYLEGSPEAGEGRSSAAIRFNARPVPVVPTWEHLVPELLAWARRIYDAPDRVLRHREGCREFERLATLLAVQSGRSVRNSVRVK